MIDAIPTDSLLRFLQATPEQLAAIDRFLLGGSAELGAGEGPTAADCGPGSGGALQGALVRIERKVDGLVAAARLPERKEPLLQGEAERIFAVLQRLRSKRAGMMAPLYDVFVATVLEGRSQRAAAKSCDCSPALLSKRVGELEKEFGLPLKQLQNYAKPLLEMETSVKGQRYARMKRGAPQDETGQYEEDDGQTAREDDDGYLREERQDDSRFVNIL